MNPTLHAQIITLKKYQAWRTGEDMRTMDEAGVVPKAITSALDAVIAIAEDHLRDATKMKEPVKDADIADVIAGHLQTSRAHAYELMEQALAQRGYPSEPVKYWLCCGSTDLTHADRKQPDCYAPDKAKFGTAESHKALLGEPVRVPSDDDLEELMGRFVGYSGCIHDDAFVDCARAILARYGAQPAASAAEKGQS